MTPVIEVVIAPNGETRLTTKGFAGSACQGASQFLEAALGSRRQEALTEEYFAAAATSLVRQENRP